MAYATDRITNEVIEIDPEAVVRLWKPIERDANTTAILLDSDDLLFVEESMKTMWARFGGDAVTQFFDDPTSSFEGVVALRKVAALTKAYEDSSGDDPTVIHLTNGETVLAAESIKTLSARLRNAGIGTVDLDIAGTARPACVVAGHVFHVDEPMVRVHEDARSNVFVSGGFTFMCADTPKGLRHEIQRVRDETAAAGRREDCGSDVPAP